MNETLALASYGWTKVSAIFNRALAALAFGLLLAGIFWQMGLPEYTIRGALGLSWFAMIFGFFVPIAMFCCCFKANLLDPSTGYDPWLLRLPIKTWKLAVIPAGLLTAWLCSVWGLVAVLVRVFDGHAVPLSQALGMSASAIFCYALAWKPQRSGWHRLAVLVMSLPLLYGIAFGVLIVMDVAPRYLPHAAIASTLIYAASIVAAICSVKQARVSTFQQSRSTDEVVSKPSSRDVKHLSFANWSDGLRWHDDARLQSTRLWARALIVVPMALLLALALPLSGATAIVSFSILSLVAITLMGSRVEPTVHGFQSSLPSYLLASPIRSRSLAWIRVRGYAVEYCQLLLFASLLLLLSLVWQENRETVWRWWTSVAEPGSAATPVRIVVAIYFLLLSVAIGVSLRVLCIQLYGRSIVVLWSTAAVVAALAIPTSVACYWFMQQTSWENVESELAKWRNVPFQLLFVGVAIKLLVDVIFVWLATHQLVSVPAAIRIVVSWSVLVIAAAFAWWAIWPAKQLPDLEVQFTTVLMSTAIVVPLSIGFAAPLAVESNRHRSI